jgi:hypothetical protein
VKRIWALVAAVAIILTAAYLGGRSSQEASADPTILPAVWLPSAYGYANPPPPGSNPLVSATTAVNTAMADEPNGTITTIQPVLVYVTDPYAGTSVPTLEWWVVFSGTFVFTPRGPLLGQPESPPVSTTLPLRYGVSIDADTGAFIEGSEIADQDTFGRSWPL